MSNIDVIANKDTLSMTDLEYAVWNLYTTEPGNIGESAADELAQLQARIVELVIGLSNANELLYEFQNNPNIELGEVGHKKIEDYLKGVAL